MPKKLTDEEREVVVGVAKAAWIFIVTVGIAIKTIHIRDTNSKEDLATLSRLSSNGIDEALK